MKKGHPYKKAALRNAEKHHGTGIVFSCSCLSWNGCPAREHCDSVHDAPNMERAAMHEKRRGAPKGAPAIRISLGKPGDAYMVEPEAARCILISTFSVRPP